MNFVSEGLIHISGSLQNTGHNDKRVDKGKTKNNDYIKGHEKSSEVQNSKEISPKAIVQG